jgi:pimeloyl-ACP methyl ester carboxylesterase
MRAAGDPELPVGGVVAIGPAGLGLQPWVGIVRRVGAALALLSRARTPERAMSLAAARVYARLAAVGPLEQDVLAHYASHVRAGDVGRIMALAVEVLRELSLDDALDVAAIGCPLSLVWGERDMLCPPGGARLITEVHAEATLRVFEGVGHCAQLERPAEIAEVVCAMEAPVSR